MIFFLSSFRNFASKLYQLSRFVSASIQNEPKYKWLFGALFEVGFATYFGNLFWIKFGQLLLPEHPPLPQRIFFKPLTWCRLTHSSAIWLRKGSRNKWQNLLQKQFQIVIHMLAHFGLTLTKIGWIGVDLMQSWPTLVQKSSQKKCQAYFKKSSKLSLIVRFIFDDWSKSVQLV